jgi:hypothetical protein
MDHTTWPMAGKESSDCASKHYHGVRATDVHRQAWALWECQLSDGTSFFFFFFYSSHNVTDWDIFQFMDVLIFDGIFVVVVLDIYISL